MTQELTPHKFFYLHLPLGMTVLEAARKLEMSYNTLRVWIARKQIGFYKFEAVAGLLGVSVQELTAAGFRRSRPREGPLPRKSGNLMPLLKSIVDSGIESMTSEEFFYIRDAYRTVLQRSISPLLVRELLSLRFGHKKDSQDDEKSS